MKYDGVLIALYILALVVVLKYSFNETGVIVVTVLLILMIIVQKIGLEKMIKKLESEKNNRLDEITSKIDDVGRKVESFKDDMNRQVVFVDNKVADLRNFVEVEVQNVHSELSRQILSMGDRINEIKQTMSSAVGSLDDRIRAEEKKEEVLESEEEGRDGTY